MAVPLPRPLIEEFEKLKVKPVTIGSYWLQDGEVRLDAGFYDDNSISAQRTIKSSKYPLRLLGDTEITQEIFYPKNRFKHINTNDQSKGWPYLSASEAFMFRPASKQWIAKKTAMKIADKHFVKDGFILVTRSGSIGRCLLATKRLEKFFMTDDLLRIAPHLPSGYVYAYLSSWIGQALMLKDQYGATVSHLEPHHIASIPIPIISPKKQQDINEEIVRAYQLRDEANGLLDRAEELLYGVLKIDSFSATDVEYLDENLKTRSFGIVSSELNERFDGSYHMPVVKTIIKKLKKGKYPLVWLGDMAENFLIPPRFKRKYVGKEHGVPFLRPAQIPLVRPHDLGYIAHSTDVIDQLFLKAGDIIISTDGTVGRVGMVPVQMAGWAGSNNIGRITYSPGDNRNGYIAAFLMSHYGYYQLTRGIYGGVIDHLEEHNLRSVLIPDAPLDIQRNIGTLVVQAFEKKEEANIMETAAIKKLEQLF